MDNYSQDIEVFDSEIEAWLDAFCRQHGIKDMAKEPQSVWNAALMYIQKNVFPDRKILKLNNLISNGSITVTNCNAYNYDLVNHICDIYIYLCMLNDKEVSVNGFSFLTGIDRGIFVEWGANGKKLSNTASLIYKKLVDIRQESLSNKLATGKQNPVGVIAILNRHYGWASPYTADSNRQRTALSAAELPRLNGGETAEIQAIPSASDNVEK